LLPQPLVPLALPHTPLALQLPAGLPGLPQHCPADVHPLGGTHMTTPLAASATRGARIENTIGPAATAPIASLRSARRRP
jgi:hypothetical protein